MVAHLRPECVTPSWLMTCCIGVLLMQLGDKLDRVMRYQEDLVEEIMTPLDEVFMLNVDEVMDQKLMRKIFQVRTRLTTQTPPGQIMLNAQSQSSAGGVTW
jgi:hypothetical protein